ncbi:rubredoxin [Catalinimonas alkaloidigena]|uniref:rubredoxin domain-containing protein n=1 Tax=Catalinimonas alkaloidigena TaxID=1075417 RepID=UPI002407266E|nr:rubredoxin domain-containing protein [Catalinimonas alkaloidigena]MDF9799543.1 rubredoxin [Catalinimonas alkaloidigena]
MLARVFAKGGIISPGDFSKVLEIAQELGSDYVHLGARQDILFPIRISNMEKVGELLKQLPLKYEYQSKDRENIVSSYVTLDVMPSTSWLAPHIYHYILDSFDYEPSDKINITDPTQGMVPLFTGNINFIASNIDNYWYMYIRYSALDAKPWCCPDLIYGFDLAKVSRAIEALKAVANKISPAEIYAQLKTKLHFNARTLAQPLEYPEMIFPYFEGINRAESDKYWMGLYWRNNRFTIKFLEVFCNQCLKTNIGIICLTPWKSILIKGVMEKDKLEWEKILGKYGINMRHSSLELNWHLPVADQDALELKNYLVRALDQQDISTYGLSFSIKTQKHVVLFTSIVIEREEAENEEDAYQYNILYAKDFNPNFFEYYYYARAVNRDIIPSLLIELSKKYYEQLNTKKTAPPDSEKSQTHQESHKLVFQCSECLSVYDEAYGDTLAKVPAGTPFSLLPDSFRCSVCGSPKSKFRQAELSR